MALSYAVTHHHPPTNRPTTSPQASPSTPLSPTVTSPSTTPRSSRRASSTSAPPATSHATQGSNPRLADPRQVQVHCSHLSPSPWTGPHQRLADLDGSANGARSAELAPRHPGDQGPLQAGGRAVQGGGGGPRQARPPLLPA
eukprot:scaffold70303_cov64-Phaeocystis_antarctica.AAC.5